MTKIHFRPYNPNQTVLFPPRIDEDIAEHDPVRMVDALVDDYPVVPLVQVVMILAVAQSNIALIGQQQLPNTVLIDHVSAIVRRGGSTACLMDSFQLRAVGTVCMTYPTAVTESHRTWQI